MKVFVTGATGYIGRAVAEALSRRGHRVSGLTRSQAKAPALAARGIKPVIGNMRDYGTWRRAAKDADALIHCAVEYGADYQALDRATLDAFLALKGRTLYTSGVWQYGPCGRRPVRETAAFDGKPLLPWRSDHEELVLKARGLVIRPGCVYGGAGGLTGLWFSAAHARKPAPMVGDGSNRWAIIHLDDLAELYARAVESSLRGELLNAVDGSRETVREMATAASRAAGGKGKVKALTLAAAEKLYGGMAHGLALDQQVDSSKAERLLRWAPRFEGFCADADRFYGAWKASR